MRRLILLSLLAAGCSLALADPPLPIGPPESMATSINCLPKSAGDVDGPFWRCADPPRAMADPPLRPPHVRIPRDDVWGNVWQSTSDSCMYFPSDPLKLCVVLVRGHTSDGVRVDAVDAGN